MGRRWETALTNRLSAAFAKPHPALVTFITGGDGDTAANLDALVAGHSLHTFAKVAGVVDRA